MTEREDLVTVYRTMDLNAEEDCTRVHDLLVAEGLQAVILGDDAPGVPSGVCEVRVPRAEAARAEQLLEQNPLPDEVESVDQSHALDLEAIYHSEGSVTAEVEALGIKTLLEANGIAAVVVGDSVLPNFPFEVQVARDQVDRARQLIAEAQSGGSAAADQEEMQGELEAGRPSAQP